MTDQVHQAATVAENAGLALDTLQDVQEAAVWLANFENLNTRHTYREAVGGFLAFSGVKNEAALCEVVPAHVIAWREHLKTSGASKATIKARLAALSSLFKHLCEAQKIRYNPVSGVKRPKHTRAQVKAVVLTPEQVRAMLEAPAMEGYSHRAPIKPYRDTAFLNILFFTGCRVEEACTLTVGDFLEDGGFWVLDFKQKGGIENRVAIHQEAQAAIRKYLSASFLREDLGNPNAPLLTSVYGRSYPKRLSVRHAREVFYSYAKKTGLAKGVSPHSARATFTTTALEQGCPLENVQKTLGHSWVTTTQMYDKRTLTYRESASLRVHY